MIRRPPRSTLSSSSAASDVYKRQDEESGEVHNIEMRQTNLKEQLCTNDDEFVAFIEWCLTIDQDKRPSAEECLTPVSYTHLRAHETPEHLVCRLLLEKKKKKKSTMRTESYSRKEINSKKRENMTLIVEKQKMK
eukprot:TRINITY_DN17723_c0_g1_i6.p1 TRINITY_DN17723_c0_g1~~TRINITY_DN17723_c0_g1_i6.p1  ORF type:complete len:135 (+),score=40.66 TRINITY_DN17723_c0_g1_i6:108-512(+)